MRVLSIVLTVLLVSPGVLADDVGDATDRLLEARRSRDPEAWRDCLHDLALDPWLVADELCGRGEAKTALALARAVQGPGTERLAAYVESRSAAPESPARAVLARVRLAFTRGDLAAVVASTDQDLSQAIRMDGGDVRALPLRVRAWCGLMDLERALEDYEACLNLDPSASEGVSSELACAFAERARSRTDSGDLDGAREDAGQAIRLGESCAGQPSLSRVAAGERDSGVCEKRDI